MKKYINAWVECNCDESAAPMCHRCGGTGRYKEKVEVRDGFFVIDGKSADRRLHERIDLLFVFVLILFGVTLLLILA